MIFIGHEAIQRHSRTLPRHTSPRNRTQTPSNSRRTTVDFHRSSGASARAKLRRLPAIAWRSRILTTSGQRFLARPRATARHVWTSVTPCRISGMQKSAPGLPLAAQCGRIVHSLRDCRVSPDLTSPPGRRPVLRERGAASAAQCAGRLVEWLWSHTDAIRAGTPGIVRVSEARLHAYAPRIERGVPNELRRTTFPSGPCLLEYARL